MRYVNLRLETLEDRIAPAGLNYYWTGIATQRFDDLGSWQLPGGTIPTVKPGQMDTINFGNYSKTGVTIQEPEAVAAVNTDPGFKWTLTLVDYGTDNTRLDIDGMNAGAASSTWDGGNISQSTGSPPIYMNGGQVHWKGGIWNDHQVFDSVPRITLTNNARLYLENDYAYSRTFELGFDLDINYGTVSLSQLTNLLVDPDININVGSQGTLEFDSSAGGDYSGGGIAPRQGDSTINLKSAGARLVLADHLAQKLYVGIPIVNSGGDIKVGAFDTLASDFPGNFITQSAGTTTLADGSTLNMQGGGRYWQTGGIFASLQAPFVGGSRPDGLVYVTGNVNIMGGIIETCMGQSIGSMHITGNLNLGGTAKMIVVVDASRPYHCTQFAATACTISLLLGDNTTLEVHTMGVWGGKPSEWDIITGDTSGRDFQTVLSNVAYGRKMGIAGYALTR